MFQNVYKNKKVLVTGHTGFKGSWLVAWLNQLGAQVAGYSNGVPTYPSHFELLSIPDIKNYQGDIRDKNYLEKVIDEFQPEIIFHLAAQALVRQSYADPVETFETNVMGMVNLLSIISRKNFVNTCILITSDKAYKNSEWCFGYRETDKLAGLDPYSSSKSCADLIATSFFYSFFQNSRTKLAITRAGNVIGGGDWAKDRIIPDCIRAWSKGESVVIRSPDATRPWQHVLEPLSGYLHLGARLYLCPERLNGEAFNFGPDSNVNETVEQLLIKIQKIWPEVTWNIPANVKHIGKEATLLKLCCDKALFELQWKPVLEIDETVSFTIDWYRNWNESKEDISSFTFKQIQKYQELAIKRKIIWV